ncbi:MAG: nucleoside phosphorylase [Acidobacteriota bacterium]|nr:nucleoside phosphorylase [Acidobacteriota bacterium]
MSASNFPQYAGKHALTSLLRPEAVIARFLDDASLTRPPAIILGYAGALVGLLRERGFTRREGYPSPWRAMWLRDGDDRLGVVEGFGFGAPGAAIVLEELIAFGATRFINLGYAGALASEVSFGDLVLCTRALRDEGVSHHYVAPARYAHPSPALSASLADTLTAHGRAFVRGSNWTVDALYRETREEAEGYRDEGVVSVDMEAAALFAIAETYGVDVASLFAISDHLLAGDSWKMTHDWSRVRQGLAHGLDAAIETLTR